MQEFDESNQENILEAHIDVVRQQAFHMKKSLDSGNLREALKFSSAMLAEMKTSKLTPRNYFNLCKLTLACQLF
jgi:vacuolar protein sorting-associated protein 35